MKEKKPGGIRSLKYSVMVILVLVWNVLWLASSYFNGGFAIHAKTSSISKKIELIAFGIVFTFSILTLLSPGFRRIVVSSKRQHLYGIRDFVLLAILSVYLGFFLLYWR